MTSVEGTVLIVQEGRFQLLDRNGIGHHFLLSYSAAVEPEQLQELQRQQARVRVDFDPAPDLLSNVAHRMIRLDAR
jgi:hypothetical protein